MVRVVIGLLEEQLELAHRTDRFHALRRNLDAVLPEEWDVAPLNPSVGPESIFGDQPELSIAELVMHVAGARVMWNDRAFGSGLLQWHEIAVPTPHDMATLLGWLEDNHERTRAGLRALADDEALLVERTTPWNTPMTVRDMVLLMINHNLYHSGEINRQRGLIRGSDGWAR